jgi:hypothetical protein
MLVGRPAAAYGRPDEGADTLALRDEQTDQSGGSEQNDQVLRGKCRGRRF